MTFTLAAAMLAAAAVAAAPPADGLTGEEAAAIVREGGLEAALADRNGRPVVETSVNEVPFWLVLDHCEAGSCRSYWLESAYRPAEPFTPEKANSWNSERRWVKATATEEGEAWITMDGKLTPGPADDILKDNLGHYVTLMGQFIDYIGPN